MTLPEALYRYTPTEIREIAEEHGDVTRDFISAGLAEDMVYAQAVITAGFGRLWLLWAEARAKDILAECRLEERQEQRGRFARNEGDIPCANCSDKYRPGGTERGETFDMEDVVD